MYTLGNQTYGKLTVRLGLPDGISVMGECLFHDHQLVGETRQGADYEQVTMSCSRCGAGHTLLITDVGSQALRIDITIFPANGARAVSRNIVQWSILTCEQTVQDMEGDGFHVIRGETTILTEPID